MEKNVKRALLFIMLTFFLSYLLAILYVILGGKWGTPGSFVVAIVYMFIPMIVVIVVQKVIYQEPLKETLGISFKLNWCCLGNMACPNYSPGAQLSSTPFNRCIDDDRIHSSTIANFLSYKNQSKICNLCWHSSWYN